MIEVENKLQRYEKYKDSGVEWLGEIPEHWETRKIKFFYKNKDSIFIDGDWIESKDIGSNEVYYFTTGNIRELKFYDKERTFISNKTFAKLNCTEIFENDILISRLNLPIGRCCLAPKFDKKTIVSVDVCVLRADLEFNRSFLVYVMNSPQYFTHTENKARGAIMKRISRTILGNISLPIPPLPEQTAIAQFLDDKTSKIEDAIAIKEQQISLLKERKQILIHKAVIRGLDDRVTMKDSGVEWIGEIPEHWEVKRVKHLLEERTERSKDGEEPLLMMSQIHGLVVRSEFHSKAEVAQNNEGNKIVKKNDLVFNKLKAHLGVFFKSNIDYDGIVSPDYAVYYSKGIIEDLKFLELLFRNPQYIKEFICRATGIVEGLIRLYTSDLFDIHVAVPPKNEQKEILVYIETASQKIETAIALKQQEIEKLKEYKSSLINGVVTGKVRVC
ncbi:restriction endonuclease subunit S [Nonlabens ulvanivorans]|uniref:Type I restriction enzyme S subunit n=1 Tax=Nonlabens ulvanivorans TaxID=906888 RepID=A0A084JX67_NONUL|nr:restriction endonuclease subunit S [Nonlabens ulvanivorans]KEZ93551.1 hypothetical protein IL45_04900 [Nonlabens ulvanivorans]PRX14128.1 type I restriction enzyme S subunit [Nonlabens ulvanivorans]